MSKVSISAKEDDFMEKTLVLKIVEGRRVSVVMCSCNRVQRLSHVRQRYSHASEEYSRGLREPSKDPKAFYGTGEHVPSTR